MNADVSQESEARYQDWLVALKAQKAAEIVARRTHIRYLESVCACTGREVGVHQKRCPLYTTGLIVRLPDTDTHPPLRAPRRYHKCKA